MSFWNSFPSRYKRFKGLSWSTRIRFAQVVVMLPVVRAALRVRGYTRVQSWVDRRRQGEPLRDPAAIQDRISADVALVGTAARLWKASCLPRSLVLSWILGGGGIDADVMLGVSKEGREQQPRFHAWVEHEGRVINDRQYIGTVFQVFDPDSVPPGADFD